MTTLARVKTALERRFLELGGVLSEESRYYVRSIEENLVTGVTYADFWNDLAQGDGGELRARADSPLKFCALHSSAALAVNTFGPFKRRPEQLVLPDRDGFRAVGFEFRCRNGIRGKNPNLDLLALADGCVLGVESKFTEMLSTKAAAFAEAYDFAAQALPSRWREMFESLTKNPRRFRLLDAAQLVRHAVGLAHHFSDEVAAKCLFYLYWEPRNANELREFKLHREEVRKFKDEAHCPELGFAALSYPELWDLWAHRTGARGISEHVNRLKERYLLDI